MMGFVEPVKNPSTTESIEPVTPRMALDAGGGVPGSSVGAWDVSSFEMMVESKSLKQLVKKNISEINTPTCAIRFESDFIVFLICRGSVIIWSSYRNQSNITLGSYLTVYPTLV